MDDKKIKPSTKKNYLSIIRSIKKALTNDDILNDNYDFLNDYKKVIDVIDKKYKIKKSKIVAVCSVLKDEELISKYKEHKFINDYDIKNNNNYISYQELKNIINGLTDRIKEHNINKKKTLDSREFNLLNKFVVLQTIIRFPLKCEDFKDMKIINAVDYKQESGNYLVIDGNKKTFYINKKKGVYYNSLVLEIPESLDIIINLWMKHNKTGNYFITNGLSISKFISKLLYSECGKKVNNSMLRNIILSK